MLAAMPLTMRPTGLSSSVDKDRPDYTGYSGEGTMGRIYEQRQRTLPACKGVADAPIPNRLYFSDSDIGARGLQRPRCWTRGAPRTYRPSGPGRSGRDLKARKGPKGRLVRRGEPVIAVKPGHRVHKAPSDPKARRAKLAVKAQLGLRAHAAKPDRKAPLAHLGPSGPWPQGDPGHPPPIRVVTGTDTVACADNELLVSLVCATGTADGTKCTTPGAAATALCMRK